MDRKTSGAEVDLRQLCITVKPYFNLANEVHFDAVRFRCRNYRRHNFNTLFLNPRLQVNLWLRQRRNYLWSSVDLAFWELTSITVFTTTYNINFLLKKKSEIVATGKWREHILWFLSRQIQIYNWVYLRWQLGMVGCHLSLGLQHESSCLRYFQTYLPFVEVVRLWWYAYTLLKHWYVDHTYDRTFSEYTILWELGCPVGHGHQTCYKRSLCTNSSLQQEEKKKERITFEFSSSIKSCPKFLSGIKDSVQRPFNFHQIYPETKTGHVNIEKQLRSRSTNYIESL